MSELEELRAELQLLVGQGRMRADSRELPLARRARDPVDELERLVETLDEQRVELRRLLARMRPPAEPGRVSWRLRARRSRRQPRP